MISVKEKIEIFAYSADIFLYPDKDWFKKLELIKNITKDSFKLTLPKESLDDIQNIFIRYFELNSKNLNIVPMASFWIDSKVMSNSTIAIEKFYNMCGYKIDSFGTPDHISKMLYFCSILLEENKIIEFNKFKEWLYWLGDFSKAIKTSIPISCYYEIIDICHFLLKENEV